MKRKVLFVDDEPKILAGLRRTLRGFRHAWDMKFVEGARQALDHLAACPPDVIVTDMRMPGMDGAQLLGEVMRRYPATVRIVLSGQCDRQAILRCVGPAHQFFAKPCDLETLKSRVALCCGLRERLGPEWQKRIVARVESLPSRPSLYAALVAELESRDASIERVAQIISQDVGMTAKTLQLVSSGFFGSPQRVSHLAQAVDFLGVDMIKSLALSSEAFFPLGADDSQGPSLERLIDHSLAVGMAAKAIAESETDDPVMAGDAWLAGLLHNVGALILAQRPSDPSCDGSGSQGLKRPALGEARQDLPQQARADAGAYLMALWGLPDPIVEAVAHYPCPKRSSHYVFTPLTALHVAHAVLEEENADVHGVVGPMDRGYLERLGSSSQVDRWREAGRRAMPEGALA